MRRAARRFVLAAACCAAAHAQAHDSWLAPSRHDAPPGVAVLELATGNRYPQAQFGVSAGSVVRSGCAVAPDRKIALVPLREQPHWLELAVPVSQVAAAPLACWAELGPAQVELEPPVVQTYFREIRATAANREAWAELQARQQPWSESYRKFTRIELANAASSAAALASARRPVGLDLEIVVLGGEPIAVGRPIAFQVLRDGKPLPGFAVELVSERNPLGIWRETDPAGQLRHTLPFGGKWLLRGTDLRLPAGTATWESRFVTLAFEAR
jgi:hypothetical protein